jgi:hypothetical protein
MDEETTIDPRHRPLPPIPAEIDAWAERERGRRQAWLKGPTESEKHDWAHRSLLRARFGLGESRLGPTPDEIEEWGRREHARRQAWAEGPSDWEKQERARGRSQGAEPPAADEIDAWSERERRRRKTWLAGPTEEEKRAWARRESEAPLSEVLHLPAGWLAEESELLAAILGEARHAGLGTLRALAGVSEAMRSYLARAGRGEAGETGQPARSRVPYA